MAKNNSSEGSFKKFVKWVDYRLPIFSFLEHEATEYPTPKNLNYWWNFGSLAGLTLILMIISGLWLAMQYTPHENHAFDSVERIMRDVNGGWFLRYLHMNGASMFFLVVYIHIARGLYYGSYKNPRELLWIIGVVIFLLMMMTAFMGYVLPWGQMSFWGATVITNLFSAIPIVGDSIVELLWGGFSVGNATLNRFFALHFLIPFLIFAVMFMHIIALHQHGSNNPTGIEAKKEDSIPFHPFYTTKDLFGFGVFMSIWLFFVFFMPNFFGEPDNYIPADPLVTPAHIVPEWYFLPYYAILRCVPDKLGGVVLMFASVLILFVVPWLDTSPVRSARFRPLYQKFFWTFIISCITLGWAGGQNPEGTPLILSRIGTVYYFSFFLIIMPLLGKIEKTIPLPKNINIKELNSKKFIIALLATISISISYPAFSSEGAISPEKQKWGFEGITGRFDPVKLRHGFQIYQEVCASCHSMNLINFRNLEGLGYSEETIKAFASESDEITDGPNDEGEMFTRLRRPSDPLPNPFENKQAARLANNGAYPVDLSLITSARANGPNYIFSLLAKGYDESLMPENFHAYPGLHFNAYYPGQQIAMPAPLSPDIVEYQDGTVPTVEQMAMDVTEFLFWAANPHMENRKAIGIKVITFLVMFTIIMFYINKRVWNQLKK